MPTQAERSGERPSINGGPNAAVDTDAERLIGISKGIHQNPELGFMEVRTAGIVAKELKARAVSPDYGQRGNEFTGKVNWVQIDTDAAAKDADHRIGAEE